MAKHPFLALAAQVYWPASVPRAFFTTRYLFTRICRKQRSRTKHSWFVEKMI